MADEPAEDNGLALLTCSEQSRHLLKLLLDNMLESVVITDHQGIIVSVNCAFSHMTGYSSQEARGQSARFMQSDHHDELFHQQMWQQISETGAWYGQVWNQRKNGEVYLQHLNIFSITNEQGEVTSMIGLGKDLSQGQSSHHIMPFFGLEDSLTGLGNRQLLSTRLDQALAQAKQDNSQVSLIVLDVGRLRSINEDLGLAWGDATLRMQADILKQAVDKKDTLVRLHGDMFAIIRHEQEQEVPLAQFANHLLERLAQPTFIKGKHLQYLQPSLGIAVYPRDAQDNAGLLQAAEYAHSLAKFNGRHRFQFVDLELHELHHRELAIQHSLQEILTSAHHDSGEMMLYYQPQVCPKTQQIFSLEALLRWHHPKLGQISPAEFIPIAEQTGQSVALDRWVITQVCLQKATWRQQFTHLPAVSINLGAKQLVQEDFAIWMQECALQAGVRPSNIKLEVTENTMIQSECAQMLETLRDLGFRISLDDFGTGYSALASLHKFSFDELKIDRSFVLEASTSARAFVLLETVAQLAHQFSLDLVVEGVETQAQLDMLASLGPLTVQGYYYYKPMPVAEITHLLAKDYQAPTHS
ncbi:GGDEF domain-containing protein [Oceanisphaera avium]|uniref:GGDEF domain-containing protein n=2 Tax=Oceanisphaera avium TaxID=1903694 RepID=A0A1Y0D0G7_9GAMM|nr:GGDEF domain-containing protein [Oceanisphaera avium]